MLIKSQYYLLRLADIIHHRQYDIFHRIDAFFVFTPTYRRQQLLIKKLHEFTDDVIMKRREKLLREQNDAINQNDDNEFGKKRKKALLDILLQSTIDNKPLSNQDIREEIDTFMFEVKHL
jgi:cytochrome P450 family 4